MGRIRSFLNHNVSLRSDKKTLHIKQIIHTFITPSLILQSSNLNTNQNTNSTQPNKTEQFHTRSKKKPNMSHNNNNNHSVPLHQSSQSDIDEIEYLINAGPTTVLPAKPPSPPSARASIPISTSPFMPSSIPPPSTNYKTTPVPQAPPPPPPPQPSASNVTGFGPPPNTLTEPVWDTVKRDFSRIASNLKLVVFPNPNRDDPGKALRDWDLWGPFFFIVFLGLTLSWSASVKKVIFLSRFFGVN